jgi:small multidrug resistance pump
VDVKRGIYWQVTVYIFYAASFSVFPTVLTNGLPLSLAYAMWSGIGTTITVLLSAIFFAEPLTWMKAGSIGLIIVGVVGLNII